jgi:hypothetical protein
MMIVHPFLQYSLFELEHGVSERRLREMYVASGHLAEATDGVSRVLVAPIKRLGRFLARRQRARRVPATLAKSPAA